jgi:FHA domain-containing protein
MMKIRVLSFNGAPPAKPLEAEFDELGGTIGRADTNLLALHDPDRHVSRLQARIDWRGGTYQLTNLGANPLDLDGHSLANGETASIRAGERIVIGRYVLEALSGDIASDSRPESPAPPASAGLDPLALFDAGVAQPAMADPFAEFLAEPASPSAAQPAPRAEARAGDITGRGASAPAAGGPGAAPGAGSRPMIPDDFDPFADPMAPPPAPPAPPAQALDDLGFGPQGEVLGGPGINTMFGLGAAGRDPAADLFAGTPLSDQHGETTGGKAVPLDPLVALFETAAPAPPPAPIGDHVPEVHGSFRPPAAKAVGDTFLSCDADSPQAAPPAPPPAPAAPRPGEAVSSAPIDRPASVPPPQPPPPDGPRADDPVQAFLEGLGIADPGLPAQLTPELMHRIGELLREATQGTIELLLARALVKRELRAEVTMIVSHDNNPLKFSPNVDVALTHLLAPRGQGFLAPVEAMRDAYGDLRAHQFGFMAGMRAALAGVLQRFDPATLEKRLSEPSMLDNLLPMNRRARLWGLYTELYRDIASEAEDDFQVLFGRAFLRAYEEQVRRMEAGES